MDKLKQLRTIISWGLMTLLVTSCAYDPHYYGPPPKHPRPAYYYPYGYYYYPSVGIYFQYSTGFYYYPSGRIWIRTRVLPPRFRLHPSDRVHLHIESNKPYLYHNNHIKKYKPRPGYKPVPQKDRSERELHLKWHKEQQKYKKPKKPN